MASSSESGEFDDQEKREDGTANPGGAFNGDSRQQASPEVDSESEEYYSSDDSRESGNSSYDSRGEIQNRNFRKIGRNSANDTNGKLSMNTATIGEGEESCSSKLRSRYSEDESYYSDDGSYYSSERSEYTDGEPRSKQFSTGHSFRSVERSSYSNGGSKSNQYNSGNSFHSSEQSSAFDDESQSKYDLANSYHSSERSSYCDEVSHSKYDSETSFRSSVRSGYSGAQSSKSMTMQPILGVGNSENSSQEMKREEIKDGSNSSMDIDVTNYSKIDDRNEMTASDMLELENDQESHIVESENAFDYTFTNHNHFAKEEESHNSLQRGSLGESKSKSSETSRNTELSGTENEYFTGAQVENKDFTGAQIFEGTSFVDESPYFEHAGSKSFDDRSEASKSENFTKSLKEYADNSITALPISRTNMEHSTPDSLNNENNEHSGSISVTDDSRISKPISAMDGDQSEKSYTKQDHESFSEEGVPTDEADNSYSDHSKPISAMDGDQSEKSYTEQDHESFSEEGVPNDEADNSYSGHSEPISVMDGDQSEKSYTKQDHESFSEEGVPNDEADNSYSDHSKPISAMDGDQSEKSYTEQDHESFSEEGVPNDEADNSYSDHSKAISVMDGDQSEKSHTEYSRLRSDMGDSEHSSFIHDKIIDSQFQDGANKNDVGHSRSRSRLRPIGDGDVSYTENTRSSSRSYREEDGDSYSEKSRSTTSRDDAEKSFTDDSISRSHCDDPYESYADGSETRPCDHEENDSSSGHLRSVLEIKDDSEGSRSRSVEDETRNPSEFPLDNIKRAGSILEDDKVTDLDDARPRSVSDEASGSSDSNSFVTDDHSGSRIDEYEKEEPLSGGSVSRSFDDASSTEYSRQTSAMDEAGSPASMSHPDCVEDLILKSIDSKLDRQDTSHSKPNSAMDEEKTPVGLISTSLKNETGEEVTLHSRSVVVMDKNEGSRSNHPAPTSGSDKSEVSDECDGEKSLDDDNAPAANANIDGNSVNESNHTKSIKDWESFAEASMTFGEVFGQPNELFDNSKQCSIKSAESTTQSKLTKDDHAQSSLASSHQKEALNIVETDSQNSQEEGQSTGGEEQGELSEIKPKKAKKYISEKERIKREKKRRRRMRRKNEAKSPALLDFAANVNETILYLEDQNDGNEEIPDTSANSLLHGFDALLGIFLQLSDELELIVTFSGIKSTKDEEAGVHVHALKAILSFADTFDQLFADLKPIILDCDEDDPDDYVDELLYRLNALIDLICETTHRVGERQEWTERAEITYVTLLELIERDSLDLICYFDDVDTPDEGVSENLHEVWLATGHVEELKALQYDNDPEVFRQICYEVMVSTDQWCPDTTVLMDICSIDPELLEEEPDQEYIDEDELAPVPQAAEHVLDKVNGDTLPRLDVFASIMRRILPPRAILDELLLDHFTSIRNTLESPLGLSSTNIVSISSIPEVMDDPDALGVSGVGKTTLAAMVAEHPDVRRYFIDGVVWLYIGEAELNYNRYTQCLRELVAQLDFYDGVPLFAELLHTPGESLSKRKRREEGFMIYARDTIAGLLEDRSILIILDDVCWEPDMDWFDFAPMPDESIDGEGDNCALVITTRCRSLLPAADTVEIDMLEESDAISLLIQESGQLSDSLMAESKEARSVVRECAHHPLAVKSVGRWLNLKHATAGVDSSIEEIHSEVIKSMDKILKAGNNTKTDMMYEILSTSLSPAINGGPTNIIKFCFAAFITVFCERKHISEFALTEPYPIIPMDMAELLFQTLLETYEVSLLKKGSLFYAQKKEAAVLIPEALSALGVLKVITFSDDEDEEEIPDDEQKFLQVMHSIHHEYGEYLAHDDISLRDFTKDAEGQWNRALVDAYLSRVKEWDTGIKDAAQSYALEMIISHMIRGSMYSVAADLLAEKTFIRGRLLCLGRENATKRHIKDCEMLFTALKERQSRDSKLDPRSIMKYACQALGRQLSINTEQITEDTRTKQVDVGRCHYEIGFTLAERRCWDGAIIHWEKSYELLLASLGRVEVVAGILYNIGVVYSEVNDYKRALSSLKRCLVIRGSIHGEEHILYAKAIQKIGDIFLNMSDYQEALESYNWALDVMYKEPDHHHIEIGEILDNKGVIHYSKGEIDEALKCHQEALRSKLEDLGEDHPELSTTYQHIGNCLSDQGNVDEAILHFDEAIRLKELDPEGGPEGDADILTIEGILNNLEGNQEQGLQCYERSLQILVTKVPYRKEKIASLLHLIGCVYLMSGEQKKAMKLFEESLQARRKVLGFVHLDVASTLFNMAFLHQTRNRLDKALRCLEEALKIRQLRLPDSEKVAVTHEKIGSLAKGVGKAKKAQIAFEEALRIRKLIHGEQHEAYASVLQELGDLMDDLGEYESAMGFYIDALDIRRSRLGLDDIAVSETLYSMGYTLNNNEEPQRAMVCFVESLSIRRYQLGDDSREVGDTLNMMGFLKAKSKSLDDALTLLWDALRIRKLGEEHVKVSETLRNIGNVHKEKGEPELAIECYEECLRIRREELGPNHEKVADTLIAIGNIRCDMDNTDEAIKSYQEALKIRTLLFGEDDESLATILEYMGTLEFRINNYDEALDLLTEFIRIRRDNKTEKDADYVNVLSIIGNIHKIDGNEAEARVCWREAYDIFQELGLTDEKPEIAAAIKNLLLAESQDKQESEQQAKKSLFGLVVEKIQGLQT